MADRHIITNGALFISCIVTYNWSLHKLLFFENRPLSSHINVRGFLSRNKIILIETNVNQGGFVVSSSDVSIVPLYLGIHSPADIGKRVEAQIEQHFGQLAFSGFNGLKKTGQKVSLLEFNSSILIELAVKCPILSFLQQSRKLLMSTPRIFKLFILVFKMWNQEKHGGKKSSQSLRWTTNGFKAFWQLKELDEELALLHGCDNLIVGESDWSHLHHVVLLRLLDLLIEFTFDSGVVKHYY